MRASLLLLAALAACGGDDGAPTPDAPVAADRVVYVVRHAETTGIGSDPTLSVAGMMRAQTLATKLANAHLSAIYTSQYARTHDTAIPASMASGVAIEVKTVGASIPIYATDLATAAMAAPGDVLIVGHSNTVPDTVNAIAHMTVPAIADTDFTRFFTITLAPDGPRLDASTY